MPTQPSLSSRSDLLDRQPTRTLRPDVVEEEVLVSLADVDLDDQTFATRVDLRLEPLMADLARDGQINAVHLRTREGGGHQILAGHRRCASAQKLGWPSIRAVLHTDLAEEEAWRLAWQDNAARRTLSPEDRWWTVARLLLEGRNQKTVAGILGVHEATVSRDAAWLRLPDGVRRQVGEDGFTLSHALMLVPWIRDMPQRPVLPLLQAYRKEPCSAEDFRKRARQHFAKSGGRPVTGVRLDEESFTVNDTKLNLDALGDEGVAALEARMRSLQLRIAAWRADRP